MLCFEWVEGGVEEGAYEYIVHFLQTHALSFGDKEPDEEKPKFPLVENSNNMWGNGAYIAKQKHPKIYIGG